MAKYRVKISSDNISETEINPVWTGEFQYKKDRAGLFYTMEMKGEMVLLNEDFTLVNDLVNECERITIVVQVYCNDSWSDRWQGYFTKFDTKPDFGTYNARHGRITQCKMTVAPRPDTKYECFLREYDESIHIFNADTAQVVKALPGDYEIGVICVQNTFTEDPECATDPGGGAPGCQEYCNIEQLADNTFLVTTCFHAEYGTGTPTIPPPYGSGWIHVDGDIWWRCPDDDTLSIGVLKYGRRFNVILEYLLAQTGCGLTLRSHFFGINATHAVPPSNDAYDYAVDNYQHLTIHQKSDVKRPDATNPSLSFIWRIKLKEILENLTTMFNVFWVIEGNDLILEHVSYFEASAGADYSDQPMRLQYEYDPESPRMERFYFADELCSDYFAGLPIEYECGKDVNERRTTLFSTDLVFIRENNGEENQDKISDENWVLISTFEADGNIGITDFNKPLAWTNLHDKLHRHYRPFSAGALNGVATTFLSTQKIKSQPPFTVPMCCDADFDPAKYITTLLGNGQVQRADYNIKKDTLKIELNY